MFGFSRQRQEYSGSSSYRYVDQLIRRAKELYIISPFIDDYYARFIRGNSRARKVYILSSSISPHAAQALSQRASRMPLLIAVLIAFANMAFLIYNPFSLYLAAASAAIVLLMLLIYYVGRIREPIQLKKPKAFYHMKMYVSDSAAIKGSANLTYAGMRRNHESISIFRDADGISGMRKDFWKIWNSS